jgi:hypothetical protein
MRNLVLATVATLAMATSAQAEDVASVLRGAGNLIRAGVLCHSPAMVEIANMTLTHFRQNGVPSNQINYWVTEGMHRIDNRINAYGLAATCAYVKSEILDELYSNE